MGESQTDVDFLDSLRSPEEAAPPEMSPEEQLLEILRLGYKLTPPDAPGIPPGFMLWDSSLKKRCFGCGFTIETALTKARQLDEEAEA